MVWMVFFLSCFIVEGIRGIFVIIAIILPGGTKGFDLMSPRVAFMAQRFRGLLAFLCSFLCGFAIYAAIESGTFILFSSNLPRWALGGLTEWVGLFCVLVTLCTFLVSRTAPFRIWFTDYKSLSDKEKMTLSRGSWRPF